ncbi:MAG TPA: methylmalonyl Co-A mutase-associated GTPase MeaB [Casimicrobiaceae bacterium]|nr:methylmalonyl Co-A mutase-associated GTPase MeaB [Casimicrobiaceae bacterium]
MAYIASQNLVPGVLEGDVRSIARLLTRAESGTDEARDALDTMFMRSGRAHVVGVTGVPGCGKSTLVAKLVVALRQSGRSIGIVAVDPSSPFSGGAILGDRIRMSDLAGDRDVYVRSMATRGSLGGLARGTLEAVDVLDAAGFDVVIIETVGVGQDEVDIARAAHTTVVVSAPGLGDDIQAIKAGILEIADVHVVSKCDKPDANRTIADLKGMLAMGLALGSRGAWRPPVVPTSAVDGVGIAEVVNAIDDHHKALIESGEIEHRRAMIAERRMLKAGEEILRDRFERERDGAVQSLVDQVRARAVSPYTAAVRLLRGTKVGEIHE